MRPNPGFGIITFRYEYRFTISSEAKSRRRDHQASVRLRRIKWDFEMVYRKNDRNFSGGRFSVQYGGIEAVLFNIRGAWAKAF